MAKWTKGQMSDSVLMGILLALTGGFLDAYTYVARGGVFANAQTGNIVLLGMNLADGRWSAALSYVIPILAFGGGVLVAEAIRWRHQHRRSIHWRQIILLIEAALLVVVAFLPVGLNWPATCLVSFVCALQVESFRKIKGNTLATTMCTGNLRTATELLVNSFHHDKKELRRSSAAYYVIILVFLAGAALGNALTRRYGQYAVLIGAGLLIFGFFIMFLREEQAERKNIAGR